MSKLQSNHLRIFAKTATRPTGPEQLPLITRDLPSANTTSQEQHRRQRRRNDCANHEKHRVRPEQKRNLPIGLKPDDDVNLVDHKKTTFKYKDSAGNRVKKAIMVFGKGSVELLIKWRESMEQLLTDQ